MEPIHIYGLLYQKVDQEIRREQLEQHFAARAVARERRQQRIDALRQRLAGRRQPLAIVRPAV